MSYGYEILNILNERIKEKNCSIIVTSIDRLPRRFKLPLYLVCNLDPSCCRGSHWITVYICEINKGNNIIFSYTFFYSLFYPARKGLYLDSFGKKAPTEIARFFFKHRVTYEINPFPVQSPSSTTCGMFCVFFLILCSKNCIFYIVRLIGGIFTRNVYEYNEIIVQRMIENENLNIV